MQAVFSGWFLVNVLAPIALPILGLVVLKLVPLPAPPENLKVMTTVKDGQLCWGAIAMCTAAIYEAWTAVEASKPVPSWIGFAMGTNIAIMLPAMLLASAGAVFSTRLIEPAPSTMSLRSRVDRWLNHYKVFVFSAILTGFSPYILTVDHFAIG